MAESRRVRLLDTTLRDGSYVINFQFTASDTALIASQLERAGVDLIEIGHGIGMGASAAGKGAAAETDEAYLEAAAQSLTHASFGMFCIPGVARLDDIDLAASHGMGFIRIGTNVTEVEQSEAFIARAKHHGMFVSANFMKSYAMEPRAFAEKARLTQRYGSDLLCVVDSAGGMLPADVEQYITAVGDTCDISLGFHGHNNLGLAVSNTLRAVELGASVVDSSLQGLGRSGGNAPTEMLVAVLTLAGMDVGVDLLAALDAGESYVRPLIKTRGLRSLDVVGGYAQFHSSYMDVVRRFSSKYRIDPRKLIMNLSEVDKVNADPDVADRVARRISSESSEVFTAKFDFHEYFGHEQDPDR